MYNNTNNDECKMTKELGNTEARDERWVYVVLAASHIKQVGPPLLAFVLLAFVREGAVAASRITHQGLSTAGYVLKKMKSSFYFD